MINLIYGLPGTGKTKYVTDRIVEDVKADKKTLLIVPEQQTVEAERAMLKLLPPSAQLSFEVLNFSRLANKLFRQYGGLSYNYITKGMKNLFMKRTLIELSPELKEYQLRAVGDSSLPALMLSQINEFKTNGISATKLALASEKLDDGHPLKSKLYDFSYIYSAYDGMVKSCYDDNSDDLENLYTNILCKHNFFKGYNIYIDSFSSFTACEHKILEKIFSQADNTTLTLPIADKLSNSLHQKSVNETSKKLLNAAGEAANIITLNTPYRTKSEALRRIWSSLWDFSLNVKELAQIPDDGSVAVIECADRYTEAEAAANLILKLTAEGYRRRDIAVISGNMELYRGIIDSTFEKAEIPFFMSEKTSIVNTPLISMIMSAFSIMLRNWRMADVIAYLKTGLTDVEPDDIDLFEIYVSTWKINGTRFMDDEWTMNPDGYSAEISSRGKVILSRANSVRRMVVESLSEFFTRLKAATNVAELCEATFKFFKSQKLSQKLEKRAELAYNKNDRKGAMEYAGAHKQFVKVLTDISSAMGDKEMTVEEFASSLKLVFDNTDIGTIPTAADEVLLGSASMLRTSNLRCAILIGVCEGEFPASISDCGFFSDNEKTQLKELEIELASDTAHQNAEELLYIYRAMTLPSDKLFMIYNTGSGSGASHKPSLAVTRTLALLPAVKKAVYENTDELDRLMSKRLAFESLRNVTNGETKKALGEIFANDPQFSPLLEKTEMPITATDCFVSEETARKIFGDALTLSQSKLEKYIKCHFAYYCNYALSLRETETASFKYSDSGTFIHHILEIFVKATVDENGFNPNMSKEEISEIVTHEADQYIDGIFKNRTAPSKRLIHLFDRLKRLALIIALDLYGEIKSSKFVPRFFEMGIGKGDATLPAYELSLKDGTKLTFEGIVDRVDIYKRDNEVFIKVVDYKTGSKSFRLSDVEQGLNIQMLMYLFAICNSESEISKERFGLTENDKLKPAGVMYISTNVSPQKTSRNISEDELIKLVAESFTREGLLLDDEDVVYAVNQDLNKNYIIGVERPKPSKKKPDEIPPLKGSALTSAEKFDEIKDGIVETLTEIAAEMRRGNASITPMIKEDPCKYCQMKQFCRIDSSAFSFEDDDSNENYD